MPPLVQNTNISSLIAQRNLSVNSEKLRSAMERLSSGYRINHASDDAAGLTISQNLVSQLRRMKQASQNTQDGISVLQITEGAYSVIGDNLQRIRELTVQAANDTNDAAARQAISTEIQMLLSDIDRISQSTNFNGINLIDGSPKPEAFIQVGPNSNAMTNVVDLAPVLQNSSSAALNVIGPATAAGFTTIASVSLVDNTTARNFLSDVDAAIKNINLLRSNIGSYQNKLESAASNLDLAIENFSTANSRIRDTDVALDTSIMTQAQTLTQAATIVLSQTNQLPQMILGLLKQ
jgi:flagellin